MKKSFKTFCKFHRKTPLLESLLNKVEGLEAFAYIKKRDSNTGVFYEISKISENIFFEEHLRTTASDIRTWFVPGKQLQPVNLVNIIKI